MLEVHVDDTPYCSCVFAIVVASPNPEDPCFHLLNFIGLKLSRNMFSMSEKFDSVSMASEALLDVSG